MANELNNYWIVAERMKKQEKPCRQPGAQARSPWLLLALFSLLLFAAANPLFADDVQDKVFARRAQSAFDQTQIQFQSQTNDPVAAF
jgi:hypothetical protein